MNRKLSTLGILLIVLVGVFVPTHTAYALVMEAVAEALFKGIAQLLMSLSSLVLIFSGMILDWILKFTIVDMAKNIGGSAGVGASITTAWATLRDVANMCFIFVLLYAAFKAMFDTNFGNFGTTVKNIIIVALLINFSLFFSKVVIDASNIVAVGFYNSITINSYSLGGSKLIAGGTPVPSAEKSLSAGYMKMLGVNTLYGSDILSNPNLKDPVQILIIGIMSAVIMLILAVMLLIAGIMFAARFIILIFLMILSPLALIAYIIPGQKGKFDDWKDALVAQSFFAPLYFALTWVVFKLGTSLLDTLKGDPLMSSGQKGFTAMFDAPGATVAIIINYVLIIGFSIAALVISKSMASKTAGFKAISGGIGAVAIGGTALAGRKLIGGTSSLISEKYRDKWSQSAGGRAGLWLANKGKNASFDARGLGSTKLAKATGADSYINDAMSITGKAGGKGGFRQAEEDKAKEKTKYAKEVYGQSDFEKAEAKKLQTDYDIEKTGEEKKIKARRLDEVSRRVASARTPEEVSKAEAYKEYVAKINKKNVFEDKEYSAEFKEKDTVKEYEKYSKAGERRQEEFAKRLEGGIKNTTGAAVTASIATGLVGAGLAGPLGAAIGTAVGAGIAKSWIQGNKAAAKKIREDSKGPSKEKKLADIISKEFTETADTTSPTTPSAPAPTPQAPTPPSGGSNRFE